MFLPSLPLPLDFQREPLWRILILTVFGVYLIASVVGAFTLKWKPWKRCIPLASVLLLFLPRVSHSLAPRVWAHHLGLALYHLGVVVFPIFVIWTFCLSWSGKQPVERMLRIASGILGGYYLWALSQGIA